LFENIAAIDIGTSSIKLVAVKTGIRDFQLKSFTFEDLDFSLKNNSERIKDAVSKVLAEADITEYKILTNMPMERAILRNISFPFNDVEKIADAIPYEAEENIPFKLDELIIDFKSLKSPKDDEGRILLAAAQKDSLYDYLDLLNSSNIKPVKMGMESEALFECYRFFNKIENETVIQIDIGCNKSIINIIEDKHLLYTRSISIGVNTVQRSMADYLKISYKEAVGLFENLKIDLTSIENNLQRSYYKSFNLTSAKFKKIYSLASDFADRLNEEILLTIKSFQVDYGNITISRALISGGGANITGIGTLLSNELMVPVVSLPFLEEYKEQKIQTQFPIAFGTILRYINNKSSSINFLKGEFIPDIAGATKKIYYLGGVFAGLAVLIFLINFIFTLFITSGSNERHINILKKRFKQYFHVKKVSDNPLADALKILKKEKADLGSITSIIPENRSILDLLNDILIFFPEHANFELKNIVINEKIIRIDGTIESSRDIDEFKEKLIKTKKFDDVTTNIRYSGKDGVRFSMNIKQKKLTTKK